MAVPLVVVVVFPLVAVAPQLVAAVVSIVMAATDTRIVWKTKLIPYKTRDEVLLDIFEYMKSHQHTIIK